MIKGTTEKNIPIWCQYALTIQEASIYFRIGEKKLRKMLESETYEEYILHNGNRILIKRKKFEQLLDEITDL